MLLLILTFNWIEMILILQLPSILPYLAYIEIRIYLILSNYYTYYFCMNLPLLDLIIKT